MENNNTVQKFLNETFGEVRAFTKDNKIWFVAKDICDILGISNVSNAVNGNKTRKENGVGEKNKGI
jgi:prophage antirepressor-like protein